MGVPALVFSLVVLDLSLVAAPPLSELPWVDESVVLGAEEAMLTGVGVVTAVVVVFMSETVELMAWLTGVELVVCATGGNTTTQPGAAGLEIH